MDPARQALQSRNRFEETLPSGLVATLRLPDTADCIIAGGVPLPVVEQVMEETKTEQNGKGTLEDAAAMRRYQNELVKRSVVALDGHPITLTDEDLKDLLPEDKKRIMEIAAREVELPLAASPA